MTGQETAQGAIADVVAFCRERAKKHRDYLDAMKLRPHEREHARWYCAMMEADHIANVLESAWRPPTPPSKEGLEPQDAPTLESLHEA